MYIYIYYIYRVLGLVTCCKNWLRAFYYQPIKARYSRI